MTENGDTPTPAVTLLNDTHSFERSVYVYRKPNRSWTYQWQQERKNQCSEESLKYFAIDEMVSKLNAVNSVLCYREPCVLGCRAYTLVLFMVHSVYYRIWGVNWLTIPFRCFLNRYENPPSVSFNVVACVECIWRMHFWKHWQNDEVHLRCGYLFSARQTKYDNARSIRMLKPKIEWKNLFKQP